MHCRGRRRGLFLLVISFMKNFLQAPRVPLALSRTALSVLVSSSLAIWATASLAQDRNDQVVVTANRIEQKVRDVVADVSVIDRDELASAGASTVAEVLSRLPGVQMSAGSTLTSVSIRGAEGRMTAVYVDGVRVDSQDGVSAIGGGAPWAFIPTAQIERIEVLRGAASAIYGSDAMGGVVNIFTRKGAAGFSPFVSAGFGGHGTQHTQIYKAGASGKAGVVDYSFGAAYEDSQGHNTSPTLPRPATAQGHILRSMNTRLGWDLSATQRLEATGLSSTLVEQLAPFAPATQDSRSVGSLDTARLAWSSQWSDAYSSKLAVNNSISARKDSDLNDYKTVLKSYLLENHLKTLGGVISAVYEHKEDQFIVHPDVWGSPLAEGSRSQNALGLGYSLKTGRHTVQTNWRNDFDSRVGAKNTGSAAYAYALSANLRVSASMGTGFKAPTLEQLYSQYGSASLRPETSRSQELAVRHTQGASQVRLAVYRNTFNDLISSNMTGTDCAAGWFCYYNVGRASTTGGTLSAEHQFGATRVHGSLDWLNARNDITGTRLSLRAQHQGLVGFDTPLADWKLGADLRGVGERHEDAANTKVLQGYALLNLKASKAIGKDWRATARLDNATNQAYDTVGYNTASPGRSLFVGVQWQQN
jgi:vitamin B12 transporter